MMIASTGREKDYATLYATVVVLLVVHPQSIMPLLLGSATVVMLRITAEYLERK